MHYFVRQDLFSAAGMIDVEGHTDATGSFLWTRGIKFDRPVPKETLLLKSAYGTAFPDFFDSTLPLMSARLLEALRASGVVNFDEYPMLLKREDSGEVLEGYSAINVLGSVDAVDSAQSPHRLRFGKPHFTGRIVLDLAKTEGMQAFRLTHGPDFIVVSERVATQLQARNFRALLIQPTEAFEGT